MIVGSYIYQGYTNNNTSMYKKGATELLKMGIEDREIGQISKKGAIKKSKTD